MPEFGARLALFLVQIVEHQKLLLLPRKGSNNRICIKLCKGSFAFLNSAVRKWDMIVMDRSTNTSILTNGLLSAAAGLLLFSIFASLESKGERNAHETT